MGIKKLEGFFKNIRSSLGLELKIRKYPYGEKKRRSVLVKHHGINLLVDVGANSGQYGKQMRLLGYQGQIISFEPLTAAYQHLVRLSEADKKWEAYNFGLGEKEEEVQLNISKNSFSSSILNINDNHTSAFPDSRYVDQQTIWTRTFDSVFEQMVGVRDRVFLKIDTQGYEMNVLKGAVKSLSRIVGIQLEMALVPLYQGEYLYQDIIQFLDQYNFKLHGVENGISDYESGRLLQMDGIFINEGMKKTTN